MYHFIQSFFIILCFIMTDVVFAQKNIELSKTDTSWWYPSYAAGFRFIDQNDLRSAENEFRKILKRDDEIAYAYYGLGLVYDRLDQGGNEAEDFLLEVINIDDELVQSSVPYTGSSRDDKIFFNLKFSILKRGTMRWSLK